MDGKNLGILARLAASLLLAEMSACGPESATGERGPSTGVASGGGSGTGGSSGLGSGGAGPSTGGAGPGTGGAGPATGGAPPATGGGDPGTSGAGSGTGGVGPGTGGVGPATGGSAPGSGGAAPGTGGAAGGTASFTVKVELSSAIPTVGIATWSLATPVDSATIEFGRDAASFELQAPVDLGSSDHRTLLLGMKPNTKYFVRVTASGGGQTHVSEVATVTTGFLPNGMPVQTISDTNAGALYAGGGFTTVCTGYTMGSGFSDPTVDSWAFTFDRDGDIVWAYDLSDTIVSTCTHARMSRDGRSMWIGNFGNTTPDGALMRISMDGLGTPSEYSLPGRSHDFAILPDEHIVYFGRDGADSGMLPESLWELDPDTGATTLLYSEVTDYGDVFDERGGHTNQVTYVPELNAISFSMYFINAIGLISYPGGQLLATFGGDKSTFPGMSWSGQHGHDVYADHISIFNNTGSNGGSDVLRFQFDLQSGTATALPTYSSGRSSQAFGDVKELPNGNYFVTYSTSAVMQEIDASLNLLREVTTTESIGYAEHRATLYGDPPPYGP